MNQNRIIEKWICISFLAEKLDEYLRYLSICLKWVRVGVDRRLRKKQSDKTLRNVI